MYHVHVQTETADTPDRMIGGAPTADLIREASAHIGERVLLKEEDIIARVASVDSKLGIVFCQFEHKQGRGKSKALGRGYPVAAFLDSLKTGALLSPHSGGSHKSRYAIEERATGTYVLDPDFRKKWRSLFYGNDYGTKQNAEKKRRLTTPYGIGNGLRHPEDRDLHPGQRWRYENEWFVNVAKTGGEATLDHEPPVVSHWNDEGHNTGQATRKAWFQKGPFEIMPRSVNSAYGSVDESTGERGAAQWKLGEDFRGPGESD
jgi:hypothetical protein